MFGLWWKFLSRGINETPLALLSKRALCDSCERARQTWENCGIYCMVNVAVSLTEWSCLETRDSPKKRCCNGFCSGFPPPTGSCKLPFFENFYMIYTRCILGLHDNRWLEELKRQYNIGSWIFKPGGETPSDSSSLFLKELAETRDVKKTSSNWSSLRMTRRSQESRRLRHGSTKRKTCIPWGIHFPWNLFGSQCPSVRLLKAMSHFPNQPGHYQKNICRSGSNL